MFDGVNNDKTTYYIYTNTNWRGGKCPVLAETF